MTRSIAVLAAVLIAGCKVPPPFEFEESGTRATYAFGTLWVDLPPEHEIDTLIAAAEAGLKSRGYVIADRRGVLEEPAIVSGRLGGTHEIQEGVVMLRNTVPGTRIEVRVEPWGNDAEGRAIMRAVLARLGYRK